MQLTDAKAGTDTKTSTDDESAVNDEVASRCMPWLQLLTDLQQALDSSRDADHPFGRVFVPERVSVRSCFPFAVNYSHGKLGQDAVEKHLQALDADLVPFGADPKSQRSPFHRHAGALEGLLSTQLGKDFPGFRIKYSALQLTAFWLDSGYGVYGGKRVELQDVLVGITQEECKMRRAGAENAAIGDRGYKSWLRSHTYRVWIELSRMGNHCLCIEAVEPVQSAADERSSLPSDVYREIEVGDSLASRRKGRLGTVRGLHETQRWQGGALEGR